MHNKPTRQIDPFITELENMGIKNGAHIIGLNNYRTATITSDIRKIPKGDYVARTTYSQVFIIAHENKELQVKLVIPGEGLPKRKIRVWKKKEIQ